MKAISDASATVTLPDGLVWADELTWIATQYQTEYSIAGALVVDMGTRLAGRPITMTGTETTTWISRADLETLREMASQPGAVCTLTLGAAQHQVMFRLQDEAIEAAPVIAWSEMDGDDWYALTALRLMSVTV